MKIITLQPDDEKGRSPYPYHCDENGLVMRQDFWKGNPFVCVGVCLANVEKVAFYFDEIEKNIDKINKGNYHPVFIAKKEMCSFKQCIRVSVSYNNKTAKVKK